MEIFDQKEVLRSFSVIADTREQTTDKSRRRYASMGVPVERATLDFGDYTWINEAFVRGGMQGAICSATKYAEQQGVEVIEITRDDYSGSSIFALKNYNYTEDIVGRKLVDWWTRTPGKIQKSNSVVGFDGTLGLGSQGRYVNLDNVGVRPAIYMYY